MKLAALVTLLALVALVLPTTGCSDPTLEEACAEYCEAIKAADCGSQQEEVCSQQCDQIREQLNGKCEEEYTETFDCAADAGFECREGQPVATSGECTEEALDLLECLGFADED
jgi:hypothetical protein